MTPRRTAAGKRQSEDDTSADVNGDPPESAARTEACRSAGRDLPPAARRALAEAEARRAEPKRETPNDRNGRGGLDPARYGDWEVKGLASDF